LVGDEANLAIVAAKPQENLDKVLIVCGGAEIRDYYNYGYRNAKPTHYSFSFHGIYEECRSAEGL